MSENEETEAELSREELVAMLNDAEFLAEHGYRMTPKGYMALVLMEHGVPHDLAGTLSAEISDRIFAAGFTYLSEDQLDLDFEVVDPDDE